MPGKKTHTRASDVNVNALPDQLSSSLKAVFSF
jgi:hypothetical protein